MKPIYCLLVLCFSLKTAAQSNSIIATLRSPFQSDADESKKRPFKKKLLQRNHGAIVGLQKGIVTAVELGGEAHWRKLSLANPQIIGASTNLEYNFGGHILGYKAGMWVKRGRVNLTYGGNLVYFTDFNGLQRYGLGPAVGFRLFGFHLINGYNFLAGDKELNQANTLHMTLRYYFPVENKFTWDRKTLRQKEKRRKERAQKQQENKEENKGIRKLFFWKQ